MKRIRIMGLCLVAMFAISAAMASASSAASPEFKTCVKATEKTPEKTYKDGEFSDKNCGKALPGGKYKLAAYNQGKNKLKLTGKGGKGLNIQYIPESETIIGDTECSSEAIKGLVTGPKTAEFTTLYKGCKTNEGKNCNSAGNGKGQISTTLLTATLLSQPGSKDGVGIAIAPKSGSVLSEYNCEGLEIVAKGGVIGEVVGGTKEAAKETEYIFAKGPGVFQKFGFLGQNVEENFASFKKFFKGEGPAPTAVILSTVKGPEIPGGELTLPATQQSLAKIKTEAFKIV
jgi:hypothetical protein